MVWRPRARLTSVSAHVDANRDIVRLVCGPHDDYYADPVAFSHAAYSAPGPGGADVIVSNAYPMDVSLTFMRSKGIIPLLQAAPGASRIIVSACPERAGHHGLFPFVKPDSWDEVVARVAAEQGGRVDLQAIVYPSAPLQIVGSG